MRWFLLLLLLPVPALAETFNGHPRVVDGDTLAFGQTRVRLLSMDAFERAQTCQRDGQEYACGTEATRALTDLIGQSEVQCQGEQRDRYNRPLVRCYARSGDQSLDLGRAMVRAGWAIAAFGHEYDQEQSEARANHAGAWAGQFEDPARFRHRQH